MAAQRTLWHTQNCEAAAGKIVLYNLGQWLGYGANNAYRTGVSSLGRWRAAALTCLAAALTFFWQLLSFSLSAFRCVVHAVHRRHFVLKPFLKPFLNPFAIPGS